MQYGLKWNPNPPVTVPQLVAYALATGVYTVLAWISVVSGPIQIPGIGGLFIAMGFGVPFAMWFGFWGLVMGFIGTSIGAGILAGLPLPLSSLSGSGTSSSSEASCCFTVGSQNVSVWIPSAKTCSPPRALSSS